MKLVPAISILFFLAWSCTQEPAALSTPGGYKYEFVLDEPGEAAKPGEIVLFWTAIKTEADTFVYNAREHEARPVAMQIPVDDQRRSDDAVPIQDVLKVASAGDVLRLVYPVDSLQNKIPNVPAGSNLYYELTVEQIMPVQEYQEYVDRGASSAVTGIKEQSRESMIGDSVRSFQAQYVSGALEGRITRTPSGLGYIMMEPGEPGTIAGDGDVVKAHYYGVLADSGMAFDNSFGRSQTFDFTLGAREAIDGWDEMFRLLNVGGSAMIFVPAGLAYGTQGYGIIPPDADLIFFVQRVE